jgi:hypothetical protein
MEGDVIVTGRTVAQIGPLMQMFDVFPVAS